MVKKDKKITAIVQARLNSVRLPGKILKEINGMAAIELLHERLTKSKEIDEIIIATSKNKKNKKLINFLKQKKINFFIGDDENVLKRYNDCAIQSKSDIIVRITGDSILIDPKLVDNFIKKFKHKKVDYLSNVCPATYPDGLDIEVFNIKSLKTSFKKVKNQFDKEHVTTFIKSSKIFKKHNVANEQNLSNMRWSLDEELDLKVINSIFKHFKPDIHFSWEEVLKIVKKNKKYSINNSIKRNEGSTISKTQKLWKRAKQIIPGGNMLLSKRPELFHPKSWPAYFTKAKNCNIWDLDNKKYCDVSLMGIGANILGYANTSIDNEVKRAISKSNFSTLNCPEDVELCEKLIEMHPWADMARLARTGGEASAIAVRIARAASGKDKVAFCGYHGWHDWYLSANWNGTNSLQPHLLPGLNPTGVPKSLKNTSFPFTYNNFDELEEIVSKHDIGLVKMEVTRNQQPKNNFLKKIRNLCNKNNIILMFDECSSGFRQSFGGLHKIYGVNPDMAWFGKAMGNGYGISAIIGKREIMDSAQNSFISSTFWTERSGPTAALKTLELMEKMKSWEIITKTGKNIQKQWKVLADRNNLNIQIAGIPALSSFSIPSKDWLKYKTFITQEMLKHNYLATNAIFVSVKHKKVLLDRYFDILDGLFKQIASFENKESLIDEKLEGPVCHSKFERLN
jgi:glutamate-1-semialdehyde 2,1-aminomutase